MKKIVSTGKSPEMPKGKVYEEGDELAQTLVDGGFATYSDEKVADVPADQKVGKEITPTKEKNEKAGPSAKAEKLAATETESSKESETK